MVAVIVLLTIAVFILVDFGLRVLLRKREQARLLREREQALDTGLRLEWTEEAISLKRVEVDRPRARILAVDDESVVLDSFRRILVLEGFNVDTVETAQEALGLVRHNDYDFVFTDLKMPGMDGLDLTKAVKHLRPDIDVVMITGYATVESAVETMKFGAMDYVEKPFSADELAAFASKLLILRQERLGRSQLPKIQLLTPAAHESQSPQVVNVPGGAFVTPEHTWVAIEINGEARIGLDDFAQKTLTGIDEVIFPENDQRVAKGEPLFTLRQGSLSLVFSSPLSGKVSRVHHDLTYRLDLIERAPVTMGWVCCLSPDNLSEELAGYRIGTEAIRWYEAELTRFSKSPTLSAFEEATQSTASRATDAPVDEPSPEWISARWRGFAECFLQPREEKVPA